MMMQARILCAHTDALLPRPGRVQAIAPLRLLSLLVLLLHGGSACAFEFRDLWQTPEQRAAEQLEQGEHEALLNDAPDADWQGLAHYRDGDFENATRAWAAGTTEADSQEVDADAEVDAAPAALNQTDENRQYNLATAETRAGNYSRALELFDELLEKGADQPDVANNRAVAEQLYELQQEQQQQDEEEGKGEQGEQGEGENTNADGEKAQPEDSASEAKAEKQTMEEEQSPQSDTNDHSEQDSADRDESDSPQSDASKLADSLDEQDDQDAAEALAAEAASQAEKEASAKDEQGDSEMMEVDDREPLTEQEQATEQWLRRIPDDPTGLLRRKLERSHGTNYPEVNDGVQAW